MTDSSNRLVELETAKLLGLIAVTEDEALALAAWRARLALVRFMDQDAWADEHYHGNEIVEDMRQSGEYCEIAVRWLARLAAGDFVDFDLTAEIGGLKWA